MEIPKWFERGFAFYPSIQGIGVICSFINSIRNPTVISISAFIFFSYFLSPIIWFLIRIYFEKTQISGVFRIGKNNKRSNAWLISHYLQSFYAHFSFFERVLKLFPGVYSAWLRLWGSRIGNGVVWTPGCEIVDRGYMNIGHRVLIGNNSYLSAHIIKKINRQFLLYVKPVTIHCDSMISYANVIGPGATIAKGVQLQAASHIYPNQTIISGGFYGRTTH